MTNSAENKLDWKEVDHYHLKAETGDVFDYNIIHTADGQVSWQGMEFDDWKYEASVDEAKSAAQAEFDAYRSKYGNPSV